MRARVGLPITAGAPDELLTAICRAFRCDWRRIGEETIVWSKTWGLDVIADVSGSRIAGWSADLDAVGERALVGIARLSDRQWPTAISQRDRHHRPADAVGPQGLSASGCASGRGVQLGAHAPDRSEFLLEPTHGGRKTPAVVRIPTLRKNRGALSTRPIDTV